MKILLASSEVFPFSKTGGLADMVGALAKYLAKARQHVSVVTPLYQGILERFDLSEATRQPVTALLGPDPVSGEIWSWQADERLTFHFVDNPGFFHRRGLYSEHGVDYPDNAERFIFFSKCVVHVARFIAPKPEIVHTHDWQAGLVPLFIRNHQIYGGWGKAPKTCFTIHNLAYQGNFPYSKFQLTNLPNDFFTHRGVEFYGNMSCLKAGIVYSDVVTTVSPRYAREVMTEEFGCGFDGILRERQNAFHGILNGVDYEEWNTTENRFLQHSFDAADLNGKAQEKLNLQAELGLPVRPDVPLFGSVCRLVDQKGVDILLGALEEMLPSDMQFVLLGNGDPKFERAFKHLAERHPSKVAVMIGFDLGLSHRIEAGCDFFVMPSRFEPCGLNQMYSLRYGAIPVVRATGGLDDSVVDVRQDMDLADGIKFHEYSARALAQAIRKALTLFRDKELLDHFRQNAMRANFSWERTAREYLEIYRRALGKPRETDNDAKSVTAPSPDAA